MFYLHKIRQTEVVTFNVKKGLLVGFKKKNHITLIISDGLLKDEKKIEYIVKPYLVANRLSNRYSFFPTSLQGLKANLKNIKLLGNGVVWFDDNAYVMNIDSNEIKIFE